MNRFSAFQKTLFFVCCLTLNGISKIQAQSFFTYDKESKVMYAISNDAQSVIVSLKIGDPLQQMKLMRNGLEVWVDYKGKTNKKTGIKYPLPSSGGFQQQGMQAPRNSNPDETPSIRPMIELLMATKREVELVGFKEELNGKFDITGIKTINIGIGFGEKDTILYQCSIPFSAFAQALDFSRTFSVGIVLKGMERPDMNGAGMPGGGGPPAGAMMSSGGGMGGGRMRGMGGGMPDMREMEKMFSDNIIWQKIQFKL